MERKDKTFEDSAWGPMMMFGTTGPGPKQDRKPIPSDPKKEKGIDIKSKKKMKNVLTFEEFLNESVSTSLVDTLINILQTAESFGLADEEFIEDIKDGFEEGVTKKLKDIQKNLSPEDKKLVQTKMDEILVPFRNAKDTQSLITFLTNISDNKLLMNEAFNFKGSFQSILQSIKNAGSKLSEWWKSNKKRILLTIVEFLVQIVIEIVFGILRSLLKSNDLKSPKFKLGGGSFGGGGSGGEY